MQVAAEGPALANPTPSGLAPVRPEWSTSCGPAS